MTKKAAEIIKKNGGVKTIKCPHNHVVKIVVTQTEKILVYCAPLQMFLCSCREKNNICDVIKKGGCPFELNQKLISD